MGVAEFILGTNKRRTVIDSIVVDVTELLTTDFAAEVTQWPVERSGDITDHIKLNPLGLSITGFISNAPTGDLASTVQSIATGALAGLGAQIGRNSKIGASKLIGTGLGAAVGAQAGGALASLIRGTGDESYPQKAMKSLIASFEARKPFTIQTYFFSQKTKNNIYTNMVITGLSFPQSVETGDGLPFQLTCQQISIIDLVLVPVSGEFIKGLGAANSAPAKADLGRQGTTTPAEKTEGRSSLLLQSVDAFKGLF